MPLREQVQLVQVDGVAILVVTHAAQMWDQQQFKAFGIDPEKKRIVALKSMQHFRAAFEPIASHIFVAKSPGPMPACS